MGVLNEKRCKILTHPGTDVFTKFFICEYTISTLAIVFNLFVLLLHKRAPFLLYILILFSMYSGIIATTWQDEMLFE